MTSGESAWTPARAAKLTAATLAVYAAGRALVEAQVVVLLSGLAIVVATVLCFPIDWMARRLPRWLAVILILLVCIGVIAATIVLVVPVVRHQLDELPEQLSYARDRLQQWWRIGRRSGVGAKSLPGAPQVAPVALPIAGHLLKAVSATIFVAVLAVFFASARDSLHRGVRRLIPAAHEPVFDEWWTRVATGLRRWTGGIIVSMTSMGLFTGLGLLIVGVKAPVLLGLLTFFGTFVPYLGAIVSAAPGLAVALSQSPRHFFYAGLVYILVHHVEGYVVQPLVMRRAVRLAPALLLVWQALMGAVFGISGIIVATPLLACAQISVNYLWTERRLHKAT